MVVLRTYFLMITVEAGLAFGALLWLPEGGGNAHSGSLLWAGRIAALILIEILAASAWLAYKAYADAAWLERAVSYLERFSQPQAIYLLNGVLFLSALLAVAALAALAPDPLPDFILKNEEFMDALERMRASDANAPVSFKRRTVNAALRKLIKEPKCSSVSN